MAHKVKEKPYIKYKASTISQVETIPTGALALDLALEGGIPLGKITLVYGDTGAGKTMLSLNTAANAMKSGYKVAYIDAENALADQRLIKNLGLEDMEVCLGPTLEDNAQAVIDNIDKYDLIVFDSLIAASPTVQVTQGISNPQQALAARVNGVFFRLLQTYMLKLRIKDAKVPAILIINQIRSNIGSFVQGYVIPGGKAQLFSATYLIYLVPSNKLVPPAPEHGTEEVLKHVTFRIDKHRLGILRPSGEFYIIVHRLPGYKVGQIYNYHIMKALIEHKLVDLEWFGTQDVQGLCTSISTDLEAYKKCIKILLEKNVAGI